ncbi:response regulator [Clostridium sp. E02]|uniref:response regulator transcription factor n=1 Tax=Clostridium sp. E02 TaxID=2487134 RepID=UPI000F54A585|nr:response regulator [Clostridium sp. E02]
MYHILLADDEQIERMALARKLKKHFGDNITISEAANGAEAFTRFEEERNQIVILDIAMPELNGVEAAEQIRMLSADCVIIFLTAYDEFSYAKRAIVVRALDYLLKPCDEEELLSVMEEAMRLVDSRILFIGKGSANLQTDSKWNLDMDPDDFSGGDSKKEVAETIRDYIMKHYMEEISMQDAAQMLHYSDAYFCKLFKQCFDQNFTSYLTKVRIREAKKLLMNKKASVKDVSSQVGYFDSNYFAKVFKRITGMLPSEFRDCKSAQK